MDRNTIIGLVLIGVILLAMPWYMKKFTKQEPVKNNEVVEESAPQERAVPQDQTMSKSLPAPANERIRENVMTRMENAIKADTVIVETDLFRGTFSSAGGGTIISWKLRKHFTGDKTKNEAVELIPEPAQGDLGISFESDKIDLSDVVFTKVQDNADFAAANDTMRQISYRAEMSGGGRVEKQFTFFRNSYNFDLAVSLSGFETQDYYVAWESGVAPTEENVKYDARYLEAYAMQGGEILKTKDVKDVSSEGSTDWAAVRNKYFMVAAIPTGEKGTGAILGGEKTTLTSPFGEEVSWKKMKFKLALAVESAARQTDHVTLYLGPMDYEEFANLNVGLRKVMNFGWAFIRPISIGFYYVLRFLYGILGSYGWAIIIFAIMIKIVLYPLTHKSYQSMKAMQELAPKIEAMKSKYKDDPQRLNQETMKLYKKHGVNPMGGCLPMLLQMPVLFALFNLFRTTIMLRQAEFLMIKDLSAPDHIIGSVNLLPILMGITMIVQQRLTMKDPKQKAMAYMMPIFFLFIFYNFSAGLNLYYLIFNLLTIAQEMFLKQRKQPEEE